MNLWRRAEERRKSVRHRALTNALSFARRGSKAHDFSEDGKERGGFAALAPAALLMLAGLSGLGVASLFTDGVEGQFVVVSAPWQSVAELVVRADGAFVTGGSFSNVIVAASDHPGFAEQLWAGGAWLVFPAPRALGCGASENVVARGVGSRAPAQQANQKQINRRNLSDAV